MGLSPSVFVGSYGYPSLKGGPLLIDDADHPPAWVDAGLGIEDIVGIRARTIRGVSPVELHIPSLQEIALSGIPLDVEVRFTRPVSFDLTFDGTVTPVGLAGDIAQMKVVDNASVEKPVDRVTSDTDLPANDACSILHQSGIDVYRISRLMSGGLLGRRRRIVPTRWAITAVDDSVSAQLKQEIVRFPHVDHVMVFPADLFSNRIAVILIPGDWRYEMIERWEKHSLWSGETDSITVDHEAAGKTGYSPIGGAYYSARLAVTEYLCRVRKCARVIVIRSVSRGYWAPLGTWVIREATRKAMGTTGIHCGSLEQAVNIAADATGFPRWSVHSTLLHAARTQKTLGDFRI